MLFRWECTTNLHFNSACKYKLFHQKTSTILKLYDQQTVQVRVSIPYNHRSVKSVASSYLIRTNFST